MAFLREPEDVMVRTGSFNFGVSQSMITGDAPQKYANFAKVCGNLVEYGDLDLLFGREVGGFREGFHAAGVQVGHLLKDTFDERNFHFVELQNNLAMWGFGGASLRTVVPLHGGAVIYRTPTEREIGAATTRSDVVTRTNGNVHHAVGNVHIVVAKNTIEQYKNTHLHSSARTHGNRPGT